jgi:hypothetical protein
MKYIFDQGTECITDLVKTIQYVTIDFNAIDLSQLEDVILSKTAKSEPIKQ